MSERRESTKYTVQGQAVFLKENGLDIENRDDFADADRGLIAQIENAIPGVGGDIWSPELYAFLADDRETPDTVNPSLWRQAVLNSRHGLYKVKDGIYQVRGYDIANITFIEGSTGWIVVDTLTNCEAARACAELFYQHVGGNKLITGIIYTHSHIDHWGGVTGVVSDEEVRVRNIPVFAPEHFMEKAVSENILAGNAMNRRSNYMFGGALPRDEKGNVDAGLGKSFAGGGSAGLIAPNVIIYEPFETHVVDGVEIVFQLTPETEAPAEMTLFFPQLHAFCPAELCTQTMHNVYTIRGAETRDAKGWAQYIDNAIARFEGKFDTVFSTHNWPVWGEENCLDYLKKQRDVYKYIHDQTLRLANHGYTMTEIAKQLRFPKSLSETWHIRGTYGTLSHNAKAVYNRYLGYYDGNPTTLDELPPEESGRKYVEYMGGAQSLLARAKADFERGEYRWVAQVLRHLVFADPENTEAHILLADTLEQLGYAAESAPWRNAYLTGAKELREVNKSIPEAESRDMTNILDVLPIPSIFDFLAVRLNGYAADGIRLTFHFDFTDLGEQYVLRLENSVLNYRTGLSGEDPDAALSISKKDFLAALTGKVELPAILLAGQAKLTGDPQKFDDLFGLLDSFDPKFNITLP